MSNSNKEDVEEYVRLTKAGQYHASVAAARRQMRQEHISKCLGFARDLTVAVVAVAIVTWATKDR